MTDRPADRIHIRDLLVRAVIGVYPEERREKQDLIVNITLYADLSRASRTDKLDDTVDYKQIKKEILKVSESSEYQLIESLAERIAQIVLAHGVDRVDVTVDKPGALRFARSVAVQISRVRSP